MVKLNLKMIKQKRIERNLSQEKLANDSNCSQNYISQLENGNRSSNPSLKVFLAIGKALRCCPFDLMGGCPYEECEKDIPTE